VRLDDVIAEAVRRRKSEIIGLSNEPKLNYKRDSPKASEELPVGVGVVRAGERFAAAGSRCSAVAPVRSGS
jgi:hypothetical protein